MMLSKFNKPVNDVDLRRAAMNWLARREYSEKELFTKLKQKFLQTSSQQIQSTIEQLQVDNLQSDDRYCETYIRCYAQKGHGPVRIRQGLQQKGVAEKLIEFHLKMDDEKWLQQIRKVYNKRFFGPAIDREDFAKRLRFLQYRGFTNEQISDCINTTDEES